MSLFFFKKAENMDQIARKSTPLPLCPSPNIVGFRSLRTKTLCMCVFYAIGGGGREGGGGQLERGGPSRVCLKPHCPACAKKQRDIFWHKKSRHAKFQQIPSNLKNRNEIGTTPPFHRALQFYSRTSFDSKGPMEHKKGTVKLESYN